MPPFFLCPALQAVFLNFRGLLGIMSVLSIVNKGASC